MELAECRGKGHIMGQGKDLEVSLVKICISVAETECSASPMSIYSRGESKVCNPAALGPEARR